LSTSTTRATQLLTVCLCILAFACTISIVLRASNLEMMMVSAAYAAVLSVFVPSSGT
jgi:hypothetical protein